jgi:hypothetical protein
VNGQLSRVAEGLSYNDITLAHRNPPPSPQKSDTCAGLCGLVCFTAVTYYKAVRGGFERWDIIRVCLLLQYLL